MVTTVMATDAVIMAIAADTAIAVAMRVAELTAAQVVVRATAALIAVDMPARAAIMAAQRTAGRLA